MAQDLQATRSIALQKRDEVRAVRKLIAMTLVELDQAGYACREKSLVQTKLDEAELWASKWESNFDRLLAEMSHDD